MYGHSDDLQRFALLSWAALSVPHLVFPVLESLSQEGQEGQEGATRNRNGYAASETAAAAAAAAGQDIKDNQARHVDCVREGGGGGGAVAAAAAAAAAAAHGMRAAGSEACVKGGGREGRGGGEGVGAGVREAEVFPRDGIVFVINDWMTATVPLILHAHMRPRGPSFRV